MSDAAADDDAHHRAVDIEAVGRRGVVVPVPVDPAGLRGPTPGQARGPHWRRTGVNAYVPSSIDSTRMEQRIVEAVAGLPDDAAVTGWAALCWLGARWFGGLGPDGRTRLDVPIALGPDRRGARARAGVELTQDWLFDDDLELVDGLLITCPLRAVTFEARRARGLTAAVRIIDMAASNDLIDLGSLAGYTERLIARPGVKQVRAATALADENVWSPQEVRMRLVWREETGRSPATNRPVFDLDGNHLFTPDLLDEEWGVLGEYDGAIHLDPLPRRRDLNRDALYRDLGLESVTMMSVDHRDLRDFARRLHAAYRRAGPRSVARSWTTVQPPWWVDTSTVAARRALDADQRAIWLRRNVS